MKPDIKYFLVATLLFGGFFTGSVNGSVINFDSLSLTDTYFYSEGNLNCSRVRGGTKDLSVDGYINSLTVVPDITIYSSTRGVISSSDKPAFQITTFFSPSPDRLIGAVPLLLFPTFQPATFGSSVDIRPMSYSPLQVFSSVDFTIAGNYGEEYFLTPYRLQHMDESLTFELKLRILSVDYTSVPDSSSCVLCVSLAALGILTVRRQAKRRGWL